MAPNRFTLAACVTLSLAYPCPGERSGDLTPPSPETNAVAVTNVPPRAGPQPWRHRARPAPIVPAVTAQTATNSPRPWTVESDTLDTEFGYYAAPACDVNGDGCADVLISEPGFDGRRGRVLAYYGSRGGLSPQPGWTLVGTPAPPPPLVHVRADGLGDVNLDGYDDVVAIFYHGVVTNGLRLDWAEVSFGSPTGLVAQAGWRITAEELSVSTILHTSRAGDVNGDGYADLRLLAIVQPTNGPPHYQLLVFHGSATGLGRVPRSSWRMRDTFKNGGPDPVCAGDVNGDGYDDLLVGDSYWSDGVHGEGRLLLYLGSRQGLRPEPVWTARCEVPIRKGLDEAYERFYGWSVASAGDANGDGLADIITGTPFTEHGDVNEGMAFVYQGSTNGLGQHPAWHIESNQAHALLGYCVSGAGDVNGDGYADVIVGVPQVTADQIQEGAALIFLGSQHGLRRKAHWCAEGDQSNAHFGRTVCGIGDANGDGFDDVLVTTPDFVREGQRVGRVSVFYGSAAGLAGSADWSIEKPFLIAAEQWLTRTSTVAQLSALGTLLAAILGLAWAWRRALRRALRAEHALALQAERARIARDLHDGLGADLARLRALDSPTGGQATLATTVQAALQSAAQAVWTVNPANDTLENLVAFLLQQAERQFSGTGVRCLTVAPDDVPALRLTADVRQHLLLAVKEAFTNVLKHAQATEARLQITFTNPLLEIAVEDNGVGLPTGPPRRFGNGLANLRQRMTQVGGQVEFSSRPGGGTRVSFRVKLKR
jgi:signal transduction histidine kinase